jgi:hypothetical protein
MKTLMFTIVILCMNRIDYKAHQKYYGAKEIHTKEIVTYIAPDSTCYPIGDTIQFSIPLQSN